MKRERLNRIVICVLAMCTLNIGLLTSCEKRQEYINEEPIHDNDAESDREVDELIREMVIVDEENVVNRENNKIEAGKEYIVTVPDFELIVKECPNIDEFDKFLGELIEAGKLPMTEITVHRQENSSEKDTFEEENEKIKEAALEESLFKMIDSVE